MAAWSAPDLSTRKEYLDETGTALLGALPRREARPEEGVLVRARIRGAGAAEREGDPVFEDNKDVSGGERRGEMNWNVSKEDMKKIQEISKRGFETVKSGYKSKIDFEMDIIATHLNGCKLDLDKLLSAPKFDFYHDLTGIYHHLNRKTGELTDCFLPRCAA